jgi:hypothetical protein
MEREHATILLTQIGHRTRGNYVAARRRNPGEAKRGLLAEGTPTPGGVVGVGVRSVRHFVFSRNRPT